MNEEAEMPLLVQKIRDQKDPLEQARLMARAKAETGVKNSQLAKFLNVHPPHISQYLRVLTLPLMVLDGYQSKLMSFTHLIIVSRLKKHEEIVQIYEEILAKNFTITQTENRVRELLYQIGTTGNYVDANRLRLAEARIASSVGGDAKVTLIQTRIKTRINIEVPGSLEKTTQFLEEFISRFRTKKKTSTEETAKLQNDISSLSTQLND